LLSYASEKQEKIPLGFRPPLEVMRDQAKTGQIKGKKPFIKTVDTYIYTNDVLRKKKNN
jgi:hypothetical protein